MQHQKVSVYAFKADDQKYHVNVPDAGLFKAKSIKEIDTISRHMIRAAGIADFFSLDIQIEYEERA